MAMQGFLTVRLVISVVVILKGFERHFRIYDHISVIGEMQNHVGYEPMAALLVNRLPVLVLHRDLFFKLQALFQDRKSTRLNSSHANISYAVFCLKKKNNINPNCNNYIN